MKFLLITLLTLIVVFSNNAASEKFECFEEEASFLDSDTTLANQYYSKAKQLFLDEQYDSSIVLFEKAADLFKIFEIYTTYFDCYYQIARIYNTNGNYSKSLIIISDQLEQLKKMPEPYNEFLGKFYFLLGNTNLYLSNYSKAQKNWEISLEYYKKTGVEKYLRIKELADINIGTIYFRFSNFQAAIEKYTEALNHTDKLKLKEALYHNLAISYTGLGDYDFALINAQKAMEINEKLYTSYDNASKINTLLSIGEIYRQRDDCDLALYYFKKVTAITARKYGETDFRLDAGYNNIGATYFAEENYDSALVYLQKSQNIKNENPLGKWKTYRLIGKVYMEKGEYDIALENFNETLSIMRSFFNDKGGDVTDTYNIIGELYHKKGDFLKALDYYQKAMISNSWNFNATDIKANQPLTDIISHRRLLDVLVKKAETLSMLFNKNKENTEYLELAFSTYKYLFDLFKVMRESYSLETSRIFFSTDIFAITQPAIKTALKLFRITNDINYKLEAFQFAERTKVGTLMESLSESKAKKISGISSNLLEDEKKIRSELAYYNIELNKEKNSKGEHDSLKIEKYEKTLVDLSLEYQKLLSIFEKEHPRYYKLKYKFDIASVDIIQKKLNKNSVLVEYFQGDSSLFIFTIDKNGYDVYESSVVGDSQVKAINNSIYNIDTKEYVELSRSLYKKLIDPIEDKLKNKKVIIIPDGILHYVPFEALLSKDIDLNNSIDYAAFPYLINHCTISYAYSATILFNELFKGKSSNNNSFIGFAPVFGDSSITVDLVRRDVSIIDTFNQDIYRNIRRSILSSDNTFTPLPASEDEVKNIYNLFREKNKPAEIYTRKNATEEVFKSQRLKNFKYVHLATHAFINEKNSKLSGIVLTSDSAQIEDGILYSEELYNLYLDADLVTLSACESGLGDIVRGEGIIGFTRGLIFSGAKNIIVSLWGVVDKSTSQLMTNFYTKILNKNEYAEALRKSKLEMISKRAYSPPRYWAPFIIIVN